MSEEEVVKNGFGQNSHNHMQYTPAGDWQYPSRDEGNEQDTDTVSKQLSVPAPVFQ